MKKTNILIIHISKRLHRSIDNVNIERMMILNNTIDNVIYGNINEFEEHDFMIAFVRGSLSDKVNVAEHYVHNFEPDSLLDFNMAFIKADLAFVYIEAPKFPPLVNLLKSLRVDSINTDKIVLQGAGCLEIKNNKMENNLFQHFKTDHITKVVFDYVARDLNKPMFAVSNTDSKEDYEETLDVINNITNVHLNYKYIELINKDLTNFNKIKEFYDLVKSKHEVFEGFIANVSFETYLEQRNNKHIRYFNIYFNKDTNDIHGGHLNKIILHADLNDEYVIENVLEWLDNNWEFIQYIKPLVKDFREPYVQEIYNLLSEMNRSLIFNVNPNDKTN